MRSSWLKSLTTFRLSGLPIQALRWNGACTPGTCLKTFFPGVTWWSTSSNCQAPKAAVSIY